jgi:hypothetical protein
VDWTSPPREVGVERKGRGRGATDSPNPDAASVSLAAPDAGMDGWDAERGEDPTRANLTRLVGDQVEEGTEPILAKPPDELGPRRLAPVRRIRRTGWSAERRARHATSAIRKQLCRDRNAEYRNAASEKILACEPTWNWCLAAWDPRHRSPPLRGAAPTSCRGEIGLASRLASGTTSVGPVRNSDSITQRCSPRCWSTD